MQPSFLCFWELTLRRDDSSKNLIPYAILTLSYEIHRIIKIRAGKDIWWLCNPTSCWSWTVTNTNSNELQFCPAESWEHSRVEFLPSLCAALPSYWDFFSPQAQLEPPELVVHGHCPLLCIWHCWEELCSIIFVAIYPGFSMRRMLITRWCSQLLLSIYN